MRAARNLIAGLLLAGLGTTTLWAQQGTPARWYRITGAHTTLSSMVTDEHVRRGYEVLDRNMNVIRRVPPYVPQSHEKQRQRNEALEKRRQNDLALQRTYVSSAYTNAMLQRQLAASQSQLGFIRHNAHQAEKNLRINVANAAAYERSGKPAPTALLQRIAQDRRQLASLNMAIAQHQAQQQQLISQFMPIINRLRYLEANPSVLRPASRSG